ncbi:glycosyltransferase [Streptomyces sp. NPDC060194]|uniref:glycosyltransferase n=1 Tax=Streptomyces sp. NPDC060194 TaxID=3347069 RepID=UPI0036533134
MTVHSHQAAVSYGSADTVAPASPRHVVTAVLVAHDGARWLPDVLAGLLGQERPVQNVVAADTGSADDSARLLGEALGDHRVLHLARRSGFGTAVDEAARTAPALTPDDLPYLKRPSGWDPVSRQWRDDTYDMPELPHGEPVQWLWLLHDDSAPEPGALAHLLRVVDDNPGVAVVGPKLRGWYDRRQLLEAGVSIAHSGRRWTGLDRREQDQGQHDQVRPVLSVSTAGMLIRRDVYEQLGGFDRALPLMRDDVDLCWRAQAAGHQVLIAPDAVLRHAEAAARERRTVDCVGRSTSSPHQVDKAGAVYTLLVNSRGAVLPWVLLRLLFGTAVRTLAYLVGKAPGQALDEITGLLATLLRPGRLFAARKRRGKGAVDPGELRPLFPPPGATVRATVEQVTSYLGSRAEPEYAGAGRHGGAVESGPGDDDADFLQVDQFSRLRWLAGKPAPVLFAVLLLTSLVACRELFAGGSLAGGALLPAPGSAGELWSRYTDAWHAVTTGGSPGAPPYLAIVATVAVLFLGSTGAALTVLLVCSVPLAGVTAYFASRPLVGSRVLRAWGAVAYAFLPAATGALATGRIGTAVLAVLLPLLARCAVSAHGFRAAPGTRASWRSVWAYALLLTITTAFTPVVWPLALVLGLAALVLRRDDLGGAAPRLLAALATPLLLLAPWSLSLFPLGFLKEAGRAYDGGPASALDLLALNPGGPGTLGGLLLIGVVLAALAALLRDERQSAVRTAWAVALAGLLFAVLTRSQGEWAGPLTLVYGIALLSAAAIGAEGARGRLAAFGFGWRQPLAVLVAASVALAPLVAAVGWMLAGADGPLSRRDPVQVPAFVAEESGSVDQARTLVLGGTTADVEYSLVRGSGVRLGDAELTEAVGGNDLLDRTVANLVAGSGADQSDQLGGFAVRYLFVRDGAPREMSRVLDATPGLNRLSKQRGGSLWRVERQVARATISAPGSLPLPIAAQAVDVHTDIPAGGEGRVLRLADAADPGWTATLDGRALTPKTVDGWAQGFSLPTGGGRLDVTHEAPFTHTAWVWAQALLGVVLVVLALPGRRREIDDDLPDAEDAVPDLPADGEGRRARRLRAQQEADAPDVDAAPDLPRQPSYGDADRWDAQQVDPYAAPYPDPYAHQAPRPAYQDGGSYAPLPPEQPYQDGPPAYDPAGPYQDGGYDPYQPYPAHDPYGHEAEQRPDGSRHQ